MKRKLKVGDHLYREKTSSWHRPKLSIEVIERCTKTLAISKNGIRYKIDCSYDAKEEIFAGKEQGEYFQYDQLLDVTEVDSYMTKIADYEKRCLMHDCIKNHKFTPDEAVQVFELLNK